MNAVKYKTLYKTRKKTALLIHGLFTTSGYWIPYLNFFSEFKLILIEVDYSGLIDIDEYVHEITKIIHGESIGVLDIVISHSLGTLIAAKLPKNCYSYSFEICPMYSATLINENKFVDVILSKIIGLSSDGCKKILHNANDTIIKNFRKDQDFIQRTTFIPDCDLFFVYKPLKNSKNYNGDHFEIESALNQISKIIY
ncbi:hypothetical protein [Polynucleobacter sp. AP-Feld-500C-C5]|uniref:hypothetical protein n=1 Tax=Polynucleobacter sp. AP-Feld-500C-C5 TaxID=2576924 RepID=UPI001C0E1DC7|nr:hypothetical protein [Polynucleobacter sp. AP-Feld-500C-C5]MBU3633161.1 hypothetical protein [Polynucleobacter sp. AP-Feld-500C-C5]